MARQLLRVILIAQLGPPTAAGINISGVSPVLNAINTLTNNIKDLRLLKASNAVGRQSRSHWGQAGNRRRRYRRLHRRRPRIKARHNGVAQATHRPGNNRNKYGQPDTTVPAI